MAKTSAPEVALPKARSNWEILHRALRYFRPHWKIAAANMACALLSLVFSFAFPQVTQFIIDEVIGHHEISLLTPAVMALLAAYLARDFFDSLRIRVNSLFEQDVIYDMRGEIYGRLQRLPVQFFDKTSSGDLMTRVMDDVTAVERVVIDGFEMGVISLVSVLAVGTILLFKNAELALYVLVPVPILIIGTLCYTKTAHARYRMQRVAAATMNALLADNLQGVRQIKAFGQEDQEGARFAVYADALRRRSLAVMNLWSIYSPAMNLVGSLGIILVLVVGGPLVTSGRMTLGELVGFIFYLPLFYDPIGRLHRLNQMFQAARASSERIYDIIDTKKEGANRQNAVALSQPVRGEVRYRQVSFGYGTSIDALKDITLHARPGQMVALVGPTGSGKSTLVNLLLAFYQRSAGKIEIDGQDIDCVTLESLRAAIGVVSQDVFLFNGSIRENVLFASGDATDEEVFAACRAANCHDFIQALPEGYDSCVGERGIRLSVGERQRISIARAILKNAPILILDEATASVDTATEHLIQEALQRLTAHRTSFVVAHRLSTVRHADQIIVLRHGEIVERGTHAELLERDGLYGMLCRTQDGTHLDSDIGRMLSFASGDLPKTMAAGHER